MDQECNYPVRPPTGRPQLIGEAWGYEIVQASAEPPIYLFVGLEGRETDVYGMSGLPCLQLQRPQMAYGGNPFIHSSIYLWTKGNSEALVDVFNPVNPMSGKRVEYWPLSYEEFGNALASQAYRNSGMLFHQVWGSMGTVDEMNAVFAVMREASLESHLLPEEVYYLTGANLTENWPIYVDYGGRQPGDATRAFAMFGALQVQEEPFVSDYPGWDQGISLRVTLFWPEERLPGSK
jgi:hypothetical protein